LELLCHYIAGESPAREFRKGWDGAIELNRVPRSENTKESTVDKAGWRVLDRSTAGWIGALTELRNRERDKRREAEMGRMPEDHTETKRGEKWAAIACFSAEAGQMFYMSARGDNDKYATFNDEQK
jgi:hypothetical protein